MLRRFHKDPRVSQRRVRRDNRKGQCELNPEIERLPTRGVLGLTTPVAPRSRSVMVGPILRKKSTGQDGARPWLISMDRMVSLSMHLRRAVACLVEAHSAQSGPVSLE